NAGSHEQASRVLGAGTSREDICHGRIALSRSRPVGGLEIDRGPYATRILSRVRAIPGGSVSHSCEGGERKWRTDFVRAARNQRQRILDDSGSARSSAGLMTSP